MLAGILDPRADEDALRARLAPLTLDARVTIPGPGVGVVSDGLGGGDHACGFLLQGTIDNLAPLAAAAGLPAEAGATAILEATFRRHGERTPEHLRGDFVAVGWDGGGKRAWLAQDQICVGALFIAEHAGGVCFASEIYLLLRLLPRRPSPDEDGVVRFLVGAEPVRHGTLYAGVSRLGAGRRLDHRDGRATITRYHELQHEPPFEDSRLDVAARLRNALVAAVTSRIPDVGSVGITLSGGFDSSVVAGAAATAVPSERLCGYSAVFPDAPDMDDRDLLDVLVHAYGLVNRRFATAPGGMLATAIMYTTRYSLPLVGPGWITEVPLLRGAHADGTGVLLDGQGGDETFGVTPYLVADRLRAGRPDRAVDLIRNGFLGAWRGVPAQTTLRMLAEYGARPLAPAALRDAVRARRDPSRYASAVLRNAPAQSLARDEDPFAWTRTGSGPLWWLHLRHLMTAVREDTGLGDYVRQRSNWFGVNGRPPLFDLELTETTLRVPPQMRFDAHLDRPIARDAVAGLLPDAIRLSRRKSNLAPFYLRGLLGPDWPLLTKLLGGSEPEIARWVRPEVVDDLLGHPPSQAMGAGAANRWTSTVWPLVSTELWLRAERDPESHTGLAPPALTAREL